MFHQLKLVLDFHEKFHALISKAPTLIPHDRAELRYMLMKEEVEEYRKGVESGDIENIAKELSDILYTDYGTIIEHGLQEKIEAIFAEVHRSNMSKDYHEYKMVKGPSYTPADIHQFFTKK